MRQEVLDRPVSHVDKRPQMAKMRSGVTRPWPARGMICDHGEAHLQLKVRMECERLLFTGLQGTLSIPHSATNDIMSSLPHYPAQNVSVGDDLWITDTIKRRRVILLYETAVTIIWIGRRPRNSNSSLMPSLPHPRNCKAIPELDEPVYKRTFTSVHCTCGLRSDVREYPSEDHKDSSARGSYSPSTQNRRD